MWKDCFLTSAMPPYGILEGMSRVDSADTISDLPDMMLISPHYHDGSRAAAGHESKTGQSEMRCHKRRRGGIGSSIRDKGGRGEARRSTDADTEDKRRGEGGGKCLNLAET